MAVVVRLRRMGTTNKPYFRVVAADERTPNKGRVLENLGWYAPRQQGVNYELNMERVDYWKGVGARTTETVDSLIKKARRGSATGANAAAKPATPTKVRKVAETPEELEPAASEPEAAPAEPEAAPAEAESVAAEAPVAEETASEETAEQDTESEKKEES
jgi:small subunit ribosomal protein S16